MQQQPFPKGDEPVLDETHTQSHAALVAEVERLRQLLRCVMRHLDSWGGLLQSELATAATRQRMQVTLSHLREVGGMIEMGLYQ